jgi:hypothetical protein
VSVFVWIESCICVNTCFLCRIVFVCKSVFLLHLVDWVLYGRALSLFVGGREREIDCKGVEVVESELVGSIAISPIDIPRYSVRSTFG